MTDNKQKFVPSAAMEAAWAEAAPAADEADRRHARAVAFMAEIYPDKTYLEALDCLPKASDFYPFLPIICVDTDSEEGGE